MVMMAYLDQTAASGDRFAGWIGTRALPRRGLAAAFVLDSFHGFAAFSVRHRLSSVRLQVHASASWCRFSAGIHRRSDSILVLGHGDTFGEFLSFLESSGAPNATALRKDTDVPSSEVNERWPCVKTQRKLTSLSLSLVAPSSHTHMWCDEGERSGESRAAHLPDQSHWTRSSVGGLGALRVQEIGAKSLSPPPFPPPPPPPPESKRSFHCDTHHRRDLDHLLTCCRPACFFFSSSTSTGFPCVAASQWSHHLFCYTLVGSCFLISASSNLVLFRLLILYYLKKHWDDTKIFLSARPR